MFIALISENSAHYTFILFCILSKKNPQEINHRGLNKASTYGYKAFTPFGLLLLLLNNSKNSNEKFVTKKYLEESLLFIDYFYL